MTVFVATAGDDAFTGGVGSDTVNYGGSAAGVTVDLGATGPQATVGSGQDTFTSIENLIGSNFTDNITTAAGTLSVQAGGADDVITVAATSTMTIDGGAGTGDLLVVNGILTAAVSNVENIEVNSLALFDPTLLSTTLHVSGDGFINLNPITFNAGAPAMNLSLAGWTFGTRALTSVIQVNATNFADTLVGSSMNDDMRGYGGADSLSGGNGDDTLDGGAGVDTVLGQVGDDTLIARQFEVVPGDVLDGGAGTDTLRTEGDADLTGATLVSIEKLAFAYADLLTPAPNTVTFTAAQAASGLAANLAVAGSLQSDLQPDSVVVTGVGATPATINVSAWSFTDWNFGIDSVSVIGGDGGDQLTGSSQADNISGDLTSGALASADVIHGGAGGDFINGMGGADQSYGDAGDDVIQAWSGEFVAGELADGGADIDTLASYGSVDFSGATLANFERLTMNKNHLAPSAAQTITFTAAQLGSAAQGFAANLAVTGSAPADNIADTIAIKGQAGATVDLTGWSFTDWGANDVISFTGSAGVDTLALNSAAKNYLLNGFQVGAGGDKLELTAFLASALQNYTPGADPFASHHLQLVQSGSDTLLQIDSNGGGDSFSTLATFKGTTASAFGAANFDGFTPILGAPIVGRTPLEIAGGPGIDTKAYAGLFRAYTLTAANGEATIAGGTGDVFDHLTSIERIKFVDGYLATGTTDTAAQVYRIYEAALGREPDPTGLSGWVRALEQGATLKTIANGFLDSPEFVARFGAGDNTAFVNLLYQNVLGRPPETEGLQAWVNKLGSGTSRADVLIGFAQSDEFINATAPAVQHGLWVGDAQAAQVARLYDTVLDRLPDQAGEVSWATALQGGASLQAVANGFVGSAEFQANYGALDNSHFVQQLYINVLGRPGEQAGVDSWVKTIEAGHSRAEVVVGFSESQEHINLTAPYIDHGIYFA